MLILRYILQVLKSRFWAMVPFVGIASITVFTIFMLPQEAYGASYFGSSGSGRPPSAFSICCCKKLDENSVQVHYGCSLYEESQCPDDTKLYPGQVLDCASDLIFTKYEKQEQ